MERKRKRIEEIKVKKNKSSDKDNNKIINKEYGYASLFDRIQRCSDPVYEFGMQLDFSVVNDVAKYLTHLDRWMLNCPFSKDYNLFRKNGFSWLADKPYRYLASSMLASRGNYYASLLCKLRKKRLNEEIFNDYFQIKMQSLARGFMPELREASTSMTKLVDSALLAGVVGHTADFLQSGARIPLTISGIREDIQQPLREMTSLLESARTLPDEFREFKEDLKPSLDTFAAVVEGLKQVPQDVNELKEDIRVPLSKLNTFLDSVNNVATRLDTFTAAPFGTILESIKEFVTTIVERASAWLDSLPLWIKMVAYALLLATALYSLVLLFPGLRKVWRDLCEFVGIPVEWSDNPVAMQMGALDAIFTRGKVRDFFSSVPQVTNWMRGIEYLFEKMPKLIEYVKYQLTGELSPKNAVEEEILLYGCLVDELVTKDLVLSNEERFGYDFLSRLELAESAQLQLRSSLLRDLKTRPVFVGLFNTKAEAFLKLQRKQKVAMAAARVRPMPVWVYIFGKPGVGKSFALRQIENDVFNYVRAHGNGIIDDGTVFDDTHVFTYNQSEDFFDGYARQFFTVVDDFAQSNSVEDRLKLALDMVHMVSNQPYSLRVATVEAKASSFFSSKVILTTTNETDDLRGKNFGIQSLEALTSRRALIVEQMDRTNFRIVTPHGYSYVGPALVDLAFLAALIGELVIASHDVPYDQALDRVLPKMTIAYSMPRLSTVPPGVVSILVEGKGKEKEGENDIKEQLGPEEVVSKLKTMYGETRYHVSQCTDLPTKFKSFFLTKMQIWMPSWFFSLEDIQADVPDYILDGVYVRSGHDRVRVVPEEVAQGLKGRHDSVRSYVENGPNLVKKTLITATIVAVVGIAVSAIFSRLMSLVVPQTSNFQAYVRRDKAVKKERTVRAKTSDGNVIKMQGIDSVAQKVVSNFDVLEIYTERPNFSNLVERNKLETYGLFLCENKVLVPGHFVRKAKIVGNYLATGVTFKGIQYSCSLKEIGVEQIKSDVYLLTLPDYPRYRANIIGQFTDTHVTEHAIARLLPRYNDTGYGIWMSEVWKRETTVVPSCGTINGFDCDYSVYNMENEDGLCGLVYYDMTTSKIVGIHLAGNVRARISYFVGLTRDLFKNHEPKFKTNYPIAGIGPRMQGLASFGMVPKSQMGFITTKTKIREGPFDMSDCPLGREDSLPASLDTRMVSNFYLEKLATQRISAPYPKPKAFDKVIPASFNRSKIRLLTIEEAIFGIPGYLKSLDSSTSAGYFFKRNNKKRKDLFSVEDGFISDVLRREVNNKLEQYRNGLVQRSIFEENFKDELRPVEKVANHNTRIFSVQDLTSLIVERMVWGTIFVEMTKDPVNSSVGLAINPHSFEWGMLYYRIRGAPEMERFPIALDRPKYDISRRDVHRRVILDLFSGLFPEPKLIEATLEANLSGIHLLGSLAYARDGTKSGSFVTGLYNSVSNYYDNEVAFEHYYPNLDFSDEIPCSFTGDDSLMSSSSSTPNFNMENIKLFFEKYLDSSATASDKTQNFSLDWNEVTYLKRRFVFTERGILGPLAESSMYDALKWTDHSFDRVKFASLFESIELEMWHYTKKQHASVVNWLNKQARLYNVPYSRKTWETLIDLRATDYSMNRDGSLRQLLSPAYTTDKSLKFQETGKSLKSDVTEQCLKNSHMDEKFNLAFHPFNEITETQTKSTNATQSNAQQKLTEPVLTAQFETPTLSFGEVGFTGEQETSGYENNAHGPGQFEETRLLERMALVDTIQWATTDPVGQLALMDVDKLLRLYPRNTQVLEQFRYYRSDLEITIRLNTNQFYFGALMATMWPSNCTGGTLYERGVLDPTVISASCADSVVKTWNYSFPFAWKETTNDQDPVYLSIDNLTPLGTAKADMPDSISVQVWARFKNIKLAYPHPVTISMQSGVKVAVPRRHDKKHPAEETSSVDVRNAIESRPITKAITDIAGPIEDAVGVMGKILPFFFDKPDAEKSQMAVINEASSDLFNADGKDTNVTIGLYRGTYVDPSMSRIPMSKNWTVRDYAAIPGFNQLDDGGGLKDYMTFSSTNTVMAASLANGTMSPLAYVKRAHMMYRGGAKVALQFFTSAFISARFAVQYAFPTDSVPADYTNGISRVVNVKGDTLDCFVLPYLHDKWWQNTEVSNFIVVKLISTIASTDTTADPLIYAVMWISAADDSQFAFPIVVYGNRWGTSYTPPAPTMDLKKLKTKNNKQEKKKYGIRMQSAMGKIFEQRFDPIVENMFSDIDTHYCTTDTSAAILDITKRYSAMPVVTGTTGLDPADLDTLPAAYTIAGAYNDYTRVRMTYWGTWRSCFLYRSGGFRFRSYQELSSNRIGHVIDTATGSLPDIVGFTYPTPEDRTNRLTIPYMSTGPFVSLRDAADSRMLGQLIGITSSYQSTTANPDYLSSRDDVQFGYPILPRLFGINPA